MCICGEGYTLNTGAWFLNTATGAYESCTGVADYCRWTTAEDLCGFGCPQLQLGFRANSCCVREGTEFQEGEGSCICGAGHSVKRSATYWDDASSSMVRCGDASDYCTWEAAVSLCGGSCRDLQSYFRGGTECCEVDGTPVPTPEPTPEPTPAPTPAPQNDSDSVAAATVFAIVLARFA